MRDLKRLMAEREAHLAAWAQFTDPPIRKVDVETEIAKLYGVLRETYTSLCRSKREQVREAIRKRCWPADFALRWYRQGWIRSV